MIPTRGRLVESLEWAFLSDNSSRHRVLGRHAVVNPEPSVKRTVVLSSKVRAVIGHLVERKMPKGFPVVSARVEEEFFANLGMGPNPEDLSVLNFCKRKEDDEFRSCVDDLNWPTYGIRVGFDNLDTENGHTEFAWRASLKIPDVYLQPDTSLKGVYMVMKNAQTWYRHDSGAYPQTDSALDTVWTLTAPVDSYLSLDVLPATLYCTVPHHQGVDPSQIQGPYPPSNTLAYYFWHGLESWVLIDITPVCERWMGVNLSRKPTAALPNNGLLFVGQSEAFDKNNDCFFTDYDNIYVTLIHDKPPPWPNNP